MLRRISYIVFLLVAAGCAVPREFDPTGGFIANREVRVVALTREGLSYYKQSRFLEAELKLRQAMYLAPDADNLKNNLALALIASGQVEEGEAILLDLARKFPQSSRYLVDLAEERARRNEFEQALDAFAQALTRAVSRADYAAMANILRSISVARFNFGDELEAGCRSAEAFALKSDQPELIRHARLLVALNQHDQAADLLINASNVNRLLQQDPEVLRQLAIAQYGKNEFAEAQTLIQRATDLSKALPEIQSNLKIMAELVNLKLGGEPNSDVQYFELGVFERLFWPENLLIDYQAQLDAARED